MVSWPIQQYIDYLFANFKVIDSLLYRMKSKEWNWNDDVRSLGRKDFEEVEEHEKGGFFVECECGSETFDSICQAALRDVCIYFTRSNHLLLCYLAKVERSFEKGKSSSKAGFHFAMLQKSISKPC